MYETLPGTKSPKLKVAWYEGESELYTRLFDMVFTELGVDFEYVKVPYSTNFTRLLDDIANGVYAAANAATVKTIERRRLLNFRSVGYPFYVYRVIHTHETLVYSMLWTFHT